MRRQSENRKGSAAIEYACILGVITAMLAAAIPVFAPAFQTSLDGVSQSVETDVNRTDARVARTAAAAATPSPATSATSPSSKLYERLYLFEIMLLSAVCVMAVYTLRKYRSAHMQLGVGDIAVTKSVVHLSRSLSAKRQQIQLAISTHWHTTLCSQLIVSELMTPGPESVGPDDPREDLIRIMDEKELHHLLVAYEGKLVGIVSDRDLKERDGETASDVMTAAPTIVSPTTLVGEAIGIMLRERVSSLPVVKGEMLCGILTASDVAMGFQCTLRVLDQIAIAINGESPCGCEEKEEVYDTRIEVAHA